jgi:sulfite dehydrogenase (cytochrome) subunit A
MRRRSVMIGLGAAAVAERMRGLGANAAEMEPRLSPLLPEGAREVATWEALPGKQKLIKLSYRPPNYEAGIETFRAALTPNDAFFVRYHLAGIPDEADLAGWSLRISGDGAERPVTLTRQDLEQFAPFEITAVNQCSGNRRGFSTPHVAGVQWGSGAMGNAVWRGVRLADVLARVGVKASAVEVAFRGADGPVIDTTPPFQKSLPLAKAIDETVLIATAMNGEPLPLLNGYPARLVVPGWTGTYWMKHLVTIEVRTKPLASFWMQKAYRVPKGMFPVELPFTTQDDSTSTPITEIVVNSLITAPLDGAVVPTKGFEVRGVAWDHGQGIRSVEVSLDGGQRWQTAALGPDHGRFSFREFVLAPAQVAAGALTISARAVNNAGETQAERLKFNPAGYQNNVPQRVGVTAA